MKNKMTVPVVIIILLIFVVLVLEGQNRYKDGNIDTYEKLITIQNSKITELDNLVNDLNRKVEYYSGELKKVNIIQDLDYELEAKDIELQEINRQIEEKKAELEDIQ